MAADDMGELLELFRQESAERFEDIEHDLLQLEGAPSNRETLQAIMRSVHSLKGSAAMFGHDHLKTVAHRLEDLLLVLTENPNLLNADVMDILLQGRDLMQRLFRAITGEEEGNAVESDHFLERLDALRAEMEASSLVSSSELGELLDLLEAAAPFAEEVLDPDAARELVHLIRERNSRSSSDSASDEIKLLGTQDVTALVDGLSKRLDEAMLQTLPDADAEVVYDAMEQLLAAAEEAGNPDHAEVIREGRETVGEFRELGLDFDDVPALCLGRIMDTLVADCHAPEPETEAKDLVGDAEQNQSQRVVSLRSKAVRISEGKLDSFLENVGELIILAEVFNNLQKRMGGILANHQDLAREITGANALLSKHVFELQDALMAVRQVELRQLTSGLERLVRDTARRRGRQVALEITGADVAIDKSLLEQVNTCLVHLLRNAIDHGIAPPAERTEQGKKPAGRICVSALSEGGHLILTVSDDGRGIQTGPLLARAVENGVITRAEADAMSESDARRLIFNDGLSTAESVSEVSGRGVGMGAVLESIERSGGSIDVESVVGEGTTVILHIPLSIMLSVVDGLVVRVSDQSFVVPVRHVEESLALADENIQTVTGRGETVRVREQVLPIRRLRDLLRLRHESNGRERHVGIVIRARHGRACLLADEILDHQQVVIKRIPGLTRVNGVRGGALLGDGTVGLVLDIEALAVD